MNELFYNIACGNAQLKNELFIAIRANTTSTGQKPLVTLTFKISSQTIFVLLNQREISTTCWFWIEL